MSNNDKYNDNNKEISFDRFEKVMSRNKSRKKKDFGTMTPYEILNYLREKDVKKNYRVLPSNDFFRRMMFGSLFAIFLMFCYTITGSDKIIQKNIDVFVNKIDGLEASVHNSSVGSDYLVDNLVQGSLKNLIDLYKEHPNKSIDDYFELIVILNSTNNYSQVREQLLLLKDIIDQSFFGRSATEYKTSVYRLIDSFLLFGDLNEAKNILDRYRQSLGNDSVFLEKEILYLLLNGNLNEAIDTYNSIVLDNIEDVNSLLSYAKLSVNFSRLDRSVEAINKLLIKDFDNIYVLDVIDSMISFDQNALNNILNGYIENDPLNERFKFIKVMSNRHDLSNTQVNIQNIDDIIKNNFDKNLPKIVKLDILTSASRDSDSGILFNEFKSIENKTFDVYYAMAKYSLDVNNFNDALNFVKQGISLNKSFGRNYEILMDLIVKQGKNLNISYFYTKMKLLDLINTRIDKNFFSSYLDNFNDINKAVEILQFGKQISAYESDIIYRLAEIYIDLKKYDLAEQELNLAISLNQKSIYYRMFGVLLIELGRVEDGISNIRLAYSIDPNDILNLNNAGAYYANVEKNIERAFLNVQTAYENLDSSYNDYVSFIIRENYFKLETLYNSENPNLDNIPNIDYLY